MASWRWFGNLHRALYRATSGRMGGKLIGLDMLLLTTTGRRTGLRRTVPMPYLKEGLHWVIVGSNNGGPTDPAWWFNLQAHPVAKIQIRDEHLKVCARLASPQERARLWPLLTEYNPNYLRYEKKTPREFPVVLLSNLTETRTT